MEHVCPCGQKFEGRSDATTCSPKCRKRLERGDFYVMNEADHAAVDRVSAIHRLPQPQVSPDAVEAVVAAAVRANRRSAPPITSLEQWRAKRAAAAAAKAAAKG